MVNTLKDIGVLEDIEILCEYLNIPIFKYPNIPIIFARIKTTAHA
jgi:hypothetical protein